MTPERVVELVARWVRFYTRGLPAPIARRRVDEIGTDMRDHIAHERARGTSDRRIAASILSRMARGMTADASWRRWVRPPKGNPVKAVLAMFVIAVGVAAVVLGEGDDSPGLQLLGVLLVVGAIARSVRTAQRSR